MSQLPVQYVKRGMWVNVEEGPILGRIITTNSRSGTLVVAILAVITTFGIGYLWNIIAFSYHQMRVNSRPTDSLMRQQQALLRTEPTPGTLVSHWLKLGWTWRHNARNSLRRSLPQVLICFLFAIAMIAVSLSTSYIVSTSNVQVLVQSPLCGPMEDMLQRADGSTNPAASIYLLGIRAEAASYSGDCYSNLSHSGMPERCGSFIRPNIQLNAHRIACPFQETLCTKVTDPGMSFDSGPVDLNSGFGLNLPDRHRVQYRRRTNCGLIDIKGRYTVTNVTATEDLPKDKIYRLYLGARAQKGDNITFEVRASIQKHERQFVTKYAPAVDSPTVSISR